MTEQRESVTDLINETYEGIYREKKEADKKRQKDKEVVVKLNLSIFDKILLIGFGLLLIGLML